jgi:hypothetical protein
MVQNINFGTGELESQRYIFTPYVFEDFSGVYFDSSIAMANSCVVIATTDSTTAYINNLPTGTGYAAPGEIKII